MNAARKSTSNVDKQAQQSAGGKAYKKTKMDYQALKSIENDFVNKYFKDDVSTERTLNNLLSRKAKSKRSGITKALDKIDVEATQPVKESIANSLFINPNMDPMSSMGTTSTSRSVPLGGLGAVTGYLLGSQFQGHGTGVVGGGLGGFVGSKIGSPYTMRKAMEADQFGKSIWQGLNDSGTGYPLNQSSINAWRNMQRNER